MLDGDRYWFAPVLARPIPELPDRVTVGVVFGNGALQHLELDTDLSRLRGMLSADHRRVLSLSLQHVASTVREMRDLTELQSALGVQFAVGEPRALLQPYSAAAVSAIRRAYLSTP